MEHLFKCPEGTDAVVIDHQQFDADEDGLFVAPLRFKQRLIDLGFEYLGEPPALPSPPSGEGTEGEEAHEEAEATEEVVEETAEEVGEEVSGQGESEQPKKTGRGSRRS